MKINSKTKIVCLLGHPVEHSFSPKIHNYLFEKYNKNNVYTCFDVEPESLEKAVSGLRGLGIEGCNITIPHKVEIIKYLDSVDKNSNLIGAVNTVMNDGGTLKGYNTDGIGFVQSIINRGHKLENKKIMILGAGGACRSIAVEFAVNNVSYIEIRNRTVDNAKVIAKIVNDNFKTNVSYSTDDVTQCDLEDIDILINTTPIGMESEECPIDERITLSKQILVYDIVYKPHNTQLIKWAIKNELEVIYGIEMLINQALQAFYIWTGIQPSGEDADEIRVLYNKNLK